MEWVITVDRLAEIITVDRIAEIAAEQEQVAVCLADNNLYGIADNKLIIICMEFVWNFGVLHPMFWTRH